MISLRIYLKRFLNKMDYYLNHSKLYNAIDARVTKLERMESHAENVMGQVSFHHSLWKKL